MGDCWSCCVNFWCCQYNCLIFPAPESPIDWNYPLQKIDSNKFGAAQAYIQLKSFNNLKKDRIPYLQISNQKSRKKKEILLYFHGNGEDIFYSSDFLIPIFKNTEITILCLQYPTYSLYNQTHHYWISNRIKQNSLEFYKYVKDEFKIEERSIFIIGRSIGSGPASYLASKVKCSKLMLISPFDNIRKVSMSIVGCIGVIIKNHFDNLQAMESYKGQLLVIHGRKDEVINFSHGQNLVKTYQKLSGRQCTFIQPPRMSHNYFEIMDDIAIPIKRFLFNQSSTRLNNEYEEY